MQTVVRPVRYLVSSAMSTVKRKVLVTFDVDGTLLTSGSNTAHKDALDKALHAVWGTDGVIADLKGAHRGMTDQVIMADVLRHHKFSEDDIWNKMPEAMAYAEDAVHHHMPKYTPKLLPGIPALPKALGSAGACVCLVTGNLEAIGWLKMEAAGLKNLFVTGGFGSDHTDRGELIRICTRRASDKFLQSGETFDAKYHIGDAPTDIRAAHEAGSKAIAVLTGKFTREVLEAQKPWVILDDLSDTQKVVDLIMNDKDQ